MTPLRLEHPSAPILPGLAAALDGTAWQGAQFAPLPDTGLAHHHVALVGSQPPALARIPKQSQLRLDAVDNLRYQAACFARAAPSAHTPHLFAELRPSGGLTRGALIVEHVSGRAAVLAGARAHAPDAPADAPNAALDDLAAIVRALASIHSLPVPIGRDPIMSPADPLAELATEIEAQSVFLDSASLQPGVRALIKRELTGLAALVSQPARPSVRLISFDAHPGNFVVREDGEAVLVDLEKCRYSYPSLDLAHATLYTSTTWEQGAATSLSPARVRGAHDLWATQMSQVGAGQADASEWHVPLRRAMWLWSVTWCAKWRVLSGAAPSTSGDGEDWAAANSADQLAQHVRGRVDHYLSATIVERVTSEFDQL